MKSLLSWFILIVSIAVLVSSCSSSEDILPETTAPVIAEVTFVTTPTNDSTPNYTFSSDEAGTITYGGSCSSSTTSATTGDNTITLVSLSDGTYSNCTIIVTDSAGNVSNTLSITSFTVDTTAPSVSSFTLSDTALITGDNATVTLGFSEAVASFSSSADITVANGTLATMSSADNVTWAGTFTPTANTEDASNTLSLATSYTDTAGNAGPAATTANYEVDTLLPSVSSIVISSATGLQNSFLNAGDVLSVTVTFSENSPVTGTPQLTLAVGDDNRTADYTSSGSGDTTKVFKYTIQAEDNDANGISIRADAIALNGGTIMDLAENNAILTHIAVSDNNSYMVDTEAPSVDNFTLSDTALKAGDNATVTLEFSEAVLGFASADDITADNGTLPAMASNDNTTWEGTFTPATNTEEDNNTLSLATSYTDLAGNAGTAETTANYAIDTLLPTISSVTAGWGTYLNATEDDSDGTVTVVTSGAENDQTVYVAFDNGDNYTGTVSNNSTSVTFATGILNDLTDGDNYTLRTNVSDAAGNAATVNTGTSFKYDRTPPSISAVAITGEDGIQNNFLNLGDNVSVTVTFSENSPVEGTPQLTLAVGDENQPANYTSSGSGDATKVFKYTIRAEIMTPMASASGLMPLPWIMARSWIWPKTMLFSHTAWWTTTLATRWTPRHLRWTTSLSLIQSSRSVITRR